MITGLIIAGNHRQYLSWLLENRQLEIDWKYISKPEDYREYHNLPILFVGDFYQNPLYFPLICLGQVNYIQDGTINHIDFNKYMED
ncbi:MAG: hypothetical protein AABY22_18360 [Nanoarchaeota archaeon]